MVEQKLRLLLREDVRESKRGIAIRVDAERLRQHLYENSSRLCAGSRTERANVTYGPADLPFASAIDRSKCCRARAGQPLIASGADS